MRLRQVPVDRLHHLGGGVRAGHREHARMRLADDVALRAEAAGDDHLAVLVERFADGVEGFVDRLVDEAAGVDDDEIGVLVAGGDQIALGAQLREDALGIDQRLRAAERDEADSGRLALPARGKPAGPDAGCEGCDFVACGTDGLLGFRLSWYSRPPMQRR